MTIRRYIYLSLPIVIFVFRKDIGINYSVNDVRDCIAHQVVYR